MFKSVLPALTQAAHNSRNLVTVDKIKHKPLSYSHVDELEGEWECPENITIIIEDKNQVTAAVNWTLPVGGDEFSHTAAMDKADSYFTVSIMTGKYSIYPGCFRITH